MTWGDSPATGIGMAMILAAALMVASLLYLWNSRLAKEREARTQASERLQHTTAATTTDDTPF